MGRRGQRYNNLLHTEKITRYAPNFPVSKALCAWLVYGVINDTGIWK